MFLDFSSFIFIQPDWSLLILRIVIGAIFIAHGTQKLSMWNMQASPQMHGTMLMIMKVLSIVEPVAGVAVLTGMFTQTAAFFLGVIMVGAIFFKIRMMKTPFMALDKTGWEFDLLIFAAAIVLISFGGGALSLDRMFAPSVLPLL